MTPRFWKNALLLLLVSLECTFGLLLLQAGPRPGDSNSQAVNLVVFLDGKVSLKRKNWNSYAPVIFGMNLRLGDLLHFDESSRVKVVCSDLTLHDIASGTRGVPCLASQPLLRRAGGSMIAPTRSWASNESFPIVLSPRKTKILSPNPVLRWTPVQGAMLYSVIVRGTNLYWASSVNEKTETVYPKTAPRLKSGEDYKLIVETNKGSSSLEPGLGLGFALLDSQEKKAVLDQEKQIEALGLPEGPTQFLIAHLYATHSLNAEAIQRLETTAQKFDPSAIERFLGDLYLNIGLPRQAEAHYLKSLALSVKEKDVEGQMLDHLALARLYGQVLGNRNSAAEHVKAGLALAVGLGDQAVASEARKTLEDLQ